MVRPRINDRERLLDAAEDIVSTASTAALTFGSLAAKAGVPKASVQSAFGNREALIDAMLQRWLEKEQARFATTVGDNASDLHRVRTHIQTTSEETPDSARRMASLLAALAGTSDQNRSALEWYKARIGDLQAVGADERKQRIAFLAGEGAFFMRHLVGFEMSDKLWHEIFSDLQSLLSDVA